MKLTNSQCGHCDYIDGYVYTSLPPKVKCSITGEFHFRDHECDIEVEPIIYCKDCKYGIWHVFIDKNGKEDHYIECINPDGLNRDVADNSYCNCGDKREGVEE